MSRTALPFYSSDISALARSLGGQLAKRDGLPGHVELLNMLARSAGCRNFQHFRAQAESERQPARPSPTPAPATPAESVDLERVRRLLRYFDAEGRMLRWPPKLGMQKVCMWVVWAAVPARRVMNEPELNRLLQARHLFGDHALLRRWLCDYGMMRRSPDCREYERVERRPPAEALALLRSLGHGLTQPLSGPSAT